MLMESFEKLPKWSIVLIGMLLVLAVGYVDYITGDYSVFVFYALPVFLVAWFAGLKSGMFISLLAGLARFSADQSLGSSEPLYAWNASQDMFFLIIVAALIAYLHKVLE